MLYGGLPFHNPTDPQDKRATRELDRLLHCKVVIPEFQNQKRKQARISDECRDLLGRILRLPSERISLDEITNHPWFLKGLPGGSVCVCTAKCSCPLAIH